MLVVELRKLVANPRSLAVAGAAALAVGVLAFAAGASRSGAAASEPRIAGIGEARSGTLTVGVPGAVTSRVYGGPNSAGRPIVVIDAGHEVQSPYGFLWHLRDGLKPNGLVAVVDSNRPVNRHGIPPAQLKCEFAAVGLQPVKFGVLTGGEVYFMEFRAVGPKPQPDKIEPCEAGQP